MTATSFAGVPFALAVLGILVWSIVLLVGTLGSLDESDENGPES